MTRPTYKEQTRLDFSAIRKANRQSSWNTPLDRKAGEKDLDKYLGCLIGGAAGDALGYAVEFLPEEAIFSRYGKDGITEYRLQGGLGRISDDTQMTLFTANGLLAGKTRGCMRGIMANLQFSGKNGFQALLAAECSRAVCPAGPRKHLHERH